MQQSKGQRCQSQEEATLVPNNHSNDLLFSPTAKHSRIQSNFNQMHIKPDVLRYAWIYYCGCLIISCAIHVTNEYHIAHKYKQDIIFIKEVPYANYVHCNFSVLLIRLFIVVPTVEECRFEDCEEEVTVYFNTKTNGIRSSYLIHFPAVLQYIITHSENLKKGKSLIK